MYGKWRQSILKTSNVLTVDLLQFNTSLTLEKKSLGRGECGYCMETGSTVTE